MSGSGKVTLVFGDGKHDFALTIGGAEELQEKTDHGPEAIVRGLAMGTWRTPAWITEPLRLGLVGAGMPATDALVLIERYAGPGQLLQWKSHAQAVILAFLDSGAISEEEDEDLGEQRGAAKPRRSRTAKSGSGSSTKSAGSSGSPRTKSQRPRASAG